MTPTTFLLVRHAHAEWVPNEMRPLSVKGSRDAERVARILAPLSPVDSFELHRLWTESVPS